MRIIKKLLLAIVILLVLLLLIGFVLPQHQHVERSATINAPASDVYRYIDNPNGFNQWSPWAKIDPEMKTEYFGPESGKGSGMRWTSEHPNVGSGSWVITEAVENQSVDMALDFGDQGTATSFFKLLPEGENTQITWGFDTDAGMNPIMRWFGLMMDSMVGGEYEKGLKTLKTQVEGGSS